MNEIILSKMLVIDDNWKAANGPELRDTIFRPSDTFSSNPMLSVRTSGMTFRNVHLRNWPLDWYPREASKEAWGTSFQQGGPSLPHLGRYNPFLYGWHSQVAAGQVLQDVRWIECSVAGFAGEGWALSGPTRGLRFYDCYARNTFAGIELKWNGQQQYQHEDVEIHGFYGRDHWAPIWWRDLDPYATQLEVPSLRAEVGKGEIRLGGCKNARVVGSRSDGATGGIKVMGPTSNVWFDSCETPGFMIQHSVGAHAPVRDLWIVQCQVAKALGAGARFVPGAQFSGDVQAVIVKTSWTNTWKRNPTTNAIVYDDGNGINLNQFDGKVPTVWCGGSLFQGWNGKAGTQDAAAAKVMPGAVLNGDFAVINSFFDQLRVRRDG